MNIWYEELSKAKALNVSSSKDLKEKDKEIVRLLQEKNGLSNLLKHEREQYREAHEQFKERQCEKDIKLEQVAKRAAIEKSNYQKVIAELETKMKDREARHQQELDACRKKHKEDELLSCNYQINLRKTVQELRHQLARKQIPVARDTGGKSSTTGSKLPTMAKTNAKSLRSPTPFKLYRLN